MRVLFYSLLVTFIACKSEPTPGKLITVKVAEESAVQMKVYPERAAVAMGEEVTFGAFVAGVTEPGLVWGIQEIEGGRIDNTGAYTAPSHTGTYHVVAMSRVHPAAQVTAVVEVLPKVVISPPVLFAVTDQTGTFTAAVYGVDNQSVQWGAKAPLGPADISPNGTFQAPKAQGAYEIFATSKHDKRASAKAIASISATEPWGWNLPFSQYMRLLETPDGGYATYGRTNSSELHRFNSEGELLWSKTYAPQNGWGIFSVAVTTQGFVLGGNAWVAGTDHEGNIRWSKTWADFNPIVNISPGENGSAWLNIFSFGQKRYVINLDSEGNLLAAYQAWDGAGQAISGGNLGQPISKKNDAIYFNIRGSNLTKISGGVVQWSYQLDAPDSALNLDILANDKGRIFVGQLRGIKQDGNWRIEPRVIAIDDIGSSAKLVWAVSFLTNDPDLDSQCSNGYAAGPLSLTRYGENVLVAGGDLLAELTDDGILRWKRQMASPFVGSLMSGVALSPLGEPIVVGNETPTCAGPELGEYSSFLFKLSPGGYFPFSPESNWALVDYENLTVDSPEIPLIPVSVTLSEVSPTFSMSPVTGEVAIPVVRSQEKW